MKSLSETDQNQKQDASLPVFDLNLEICEDKTSTLTVSSSFPLKFQKSFIDDANQRLCLKIQPKHKIPNTDIQLIRQADYYYIKPIWFVIEKEAHMKRPNHILLYRFYTVDT